MSELATWVTNAPDYYDMTRAYKSLGRIKQMVILKEREIDRAEQQIVIEDEKPRSNAARSKRFQVTGTMLDELAVLEAYCKQLEFAKSMFASAAYTIKMRFDAPVGEVSE
jgi:hypothetical protein